MPWGTKDVVMLREEFIYRIKELKETISKVCREYKISRPTAYKWLSRYEEQGRQGLIDRSRRPSQLSKKIEEEARNLILSLREKYPSWGGRKLRQLLVNEAVPNIPSESTFNRTISREKKLFLENTSSKKRYICFERKNPNELWQMDFKGYFRIHEGQCHPLTILDDCSRYALCLKACLREDTISVRKPLEEVFEEYGLPEAMTMDNGPPWFGGPDQRFSTLTIGLMRLGIQVSHSRPYHPQTQGKDERFHRTLKTELLKYQNFQDFLEVQKKSDEWRYIYNHIRPHEALQMSHPSNKYQISSRKLPKEISDIEYRAGDEIRIISHSGEIRFCGRRYFLGEALRGEKVAIRQRTEIKWDIYYANNWLKSFEIKV